MKKHSVLKSVLIVLFLLTISFSAFGKEPYKIGWCGPLSGPAAYMGEVGKKTVMMVVDQVNAKGGINGNLVEVVYYDTENKPDVTVQVFNRLIKKDRVLAIVGPTTSVEATAAVNIAEQNKIPTIMPTLTSKVVVPIRKYVFKTPISDVETVEKSLQYFKAKGLTKIAVITSQDGYGEAGLEAIEKTAPGMGIEIVVKEKVGTMDNDMTPTVAKVRNSGAQALFEFTHLRPSVILSRNIKQVGLSIPVMRSMGCVQDAFLKDAEGTIEGHTGVTYKFIDAASLPDGDRQKPVIVRYQSDFLKKYGQKPIMFGANAYDAIHILVAALEKAGPDKNKIRDAIEKTTNYIGVGGIFNYSSTNHSPDHGSVIVYRVVRGKWEIVYKWSGVNGK
ncbi:MAG: ABC transporter substrate-binding protein [Proteobacteria bacterium]|nr:ABC transporter substrate-binding protein [Pseudomonadota bacterium]